MRAEGYPIEILDSLREPLLVLDDRLVVERVTPAFCQTFRVPPADVLDRRIDSIGNGEWDIPALEALFAAVLGGTGSIEDFRVEHDFEAIGPRVMILNARRFGPVEETRILLAIEDVTERERARADLEAYARELERSNQALEEFAYIASHELQEPLRKIIAFGERLAEGVGDELDEAPRENLDRMVAASARLRGMIDDLLAYSRIHRARPKFTPVELTRTVERVIGNLEARIQLTGARVQLDPLPVVEGDEELLRLLFQNLVENALKYGRKGVAPEIVIRSENGGDRVRVMVTDNGIGLDEKYADRIFQPFQRLHGRGAYEGSGIGLAICRSVVEHHDGEIAVQSVPGEGATFVVSLPARQANKAINGRNKAMNGRNKAINRRGVA